ncbi:MAG: NAD(P)H-dependent oxidoreductase [Sedimentisphaerales bacterium]|nr:NAD(P)H-dependent oxidoreductase [Sedimentisphaerales bacterium]
MAKGIVIYYSRSGNTREMAEMVAKSMGDAGLETDCKSVDKVKVDDLLAYNAIVVGSPTYYGTMAAQIKQLIDESVVKHGQLDGKVGAAFTSSANVGGGNETTVLSILQAMLISGMVIQGDPQGDHYGPVSIGKPDQRVEKLCGRWGRRIAELTKKLGR